MQPRLLLGQGISAVTGHRMAGSDQLPNALLLSEHLLSTKIEGAFLRGSGSKQTCEGSALVL